MDPVTALGFLLLVLAIGIIGWASWHLVFSFQTEPAKKHYFILLGGVGTTSMLLLVTGIFGWFRPWIVAGLFLLIFFLYLLRLLIRKERFPLASFIRYAAFLALFGCACLALFWVARPFETVIGSDDASAFVGASHYTVRHGGVRYHDELAASMTPEERDAFFYKSRNKPGEKLIWIRLRGGFMLFESEPLEVTIGFFHLFPLWLALGNLALGEVGFEYIMTLLSMLCLVTLFFLGSALGGRLLGISLALLSAVFLPQLYYFLHPMSEVLLELLLLSGIVTFMERHAQERRCQLLAGVLWGMALFTKLEALIFFPLCLTLVFAVTPGIRTQVRRWSVMVLTLAFFYLLTVHYHIENGGYFFQVYNWCKHIEVMKAAFFFIDIDPWQRAVLFAAIWLLIAAALKLPRLDLFMAGFAFLVFVLFFLVFIMLRYSFTKTILTLEWFSFYMDHWIFYALLAGLFAFLPVLMKERSRPRTWIIFAFFSVPAAIYLIDPMVHRYHPFAIRRFVPLFFPLLFVLSCTGWIQIFTTIFSVRRIRLAACSLLFGVMAVSFAADSALLIKKPLFHDLLGPLRASMEKLPRDALVLIAHEVGGSALHMHTQCAGGRDTLLQAVSSPGDLNEVQNAYIEKELKTRRVYLILERAATPPQAVNRHLDMTFVDRMNVSFLRIPQADTFTGTVENARYEFLIFELGKKSDSTLIDIGDPTMDLPCLLSGFFECEGGMENTYRWTDGTAVLAVPPVSRYQIALAGGQPETKVDILLNGNVVKTVDALSPEKILIDVELPDSLKGPEKLLLSLRSATFTPQGADNRELGVRLHEIILNE